MPNVPTRVATADPFGNYKKDKDQSRHPQVIRPEFYAMANAVVNELARAIQTKPAEPADERP